MVTKQCLLFAFPVCKSKTRNIQMLVCFTAPCKTCPRQTQQALNVNPGDSIPTEMQTLPTARASGGGTTQIYLHGLTRASGCACWTLVHAHSRLTGHCHSPAPIRPTQSYYLSCCYMDALSGHPLWYPNLSGIFILQDPIGSITLALLVRASSGSL